MKRLNEFTKQSSKRDTIVSIISIDTLSTEIIDLFNEHFVKICEGNSGNSLETVKKMVRTFYNSKSEEQKKGIAAEFFIHLFFTLFGLKQECLFGNLEENSVKKGFDGVYTKNDEVWFMESKSGEKSDKINHTTKIKEAYSDILKTCSLKTPNNPWKNAYNHSCHRDSNSSDDLIKFLKQASNDFINEIEQDINKLNLIPCGTIYIDRSHIIENNDDVYKTAELCITEDKYKKMHIVCATIQTLSLFDDYLNC